MKTSDVQKLHEILSLIRENKPIATRTLEWGFSILREESKKLDKRAKIFRASIAKTRNEGI